MLTSGNVLHLGGQFPSVVSDKKMCPFCWLCVCCRIWLCVQCATVMTACHACLDTKRIRTNDVRNGTNYWLGEDMAANEWPVFNFYSQNNLPLRSQSTSREVKSPYWVSSAAPVFRNPPLVMSQRRQWCFSQVRQVFVYSNAVTISRIISLWYLLTVAVVASCS